MLVHVHNNILDNINLADVANQFVDRKDSRKKHSGIFLRIIHNTVEPLLTVTSIHRSPPYKQPEKKVPAKLMVKLL